MRLRVRSILRTKNRITVPSVNLELEKTYICTALVCWFCSRESRAKRHCERELLLNGIDSKETFVWTLCAKRLTTNGFVSGIVVPSVLCRASSSTMVHLLRNPLSPAFPKSSTQRSWQSTVWDRFPKDILKVPPGSSAARRRRSEWRTGNWNFVLHHWPGMTILATSAACPRWSFSEGSHVRNRLYYYKNGSTQRDPCTLSPNRSLFFHLSRDFLALAILCALREHCSR